MQKCTSCQKAPATIHVLDLQKGAIVESHSLCESCAEQKGVVQAKTTVKFTTEILEMIGGFQKAPGVVRGAEGEGPVCPGCHLTSTEFRMRGRLGCPRCYEVFRRSLLPVLERVHDATSHRGRYPGRSVEAATGPVSLTALRRRLSDAIAGERYEEAAKLRDELQKAERDRTTRQPGDEQ